MNGSRASVSFNVLSAAILAGSILISSAFPQSPASSSSAGSATPGATSRQTTTVAHYHPDRFAGRAGKYYELVWGIDSMSVKYTESGEVIRFSYRIIDPQKASVLNDKKFEPGLIDPKAGVKLVVPSLEKVGQLRQSSTPEAGKVYWMAFSNKGRHVKKGDHVDVIIGNFHAQGLVVD